QSRYLAMRLLYAGLLLGVLCIMYLEMTHLRWRPESFAGMFLFGLFTAILVGLISLLAIVTSTHGRRILAMLIALVIGVFVLSIVLVNLLAEQPIDLEQPTNRRDAAVLAESYFGVFMIVQLALVALLTPAYVGGAIADEKDKKTLEFMLATDLNNHEI